MINQNLIIYKHKVLHQVLKELEDVLNFNVIEILDEKLLNRKIKNLKNYLIITQTKLKLSENQFVVDQLPIKLTYLAEKMNIEFLKQQFSNQSELNINNYLLNLNAKEISLKNTKLKLTEKEINIILYLMKNKGEVSVKNLQSQVWGYQKDLETHTVETHIHRLRKKILNNFKDNNFIKSKKNGYQID